MYMFRYLCVTIHVFSFRAACFSTVQFITSALLLRNCDCPSVSKLLLNFREMQRSKCMFCVVLRTVCHRRTFYQQSLSFFPLSNKLTAKIHYFKDWAKCNIQTLKIINASQDSLSKGPKCFAMITLLPPPRRLCFCRFLFVCLSVCLFVCVLAR